MIAVSNTEARRLVGALQSPPEDTRFEMVLVQDHETGGHEPGAYFSCAGCMVHRAKMAA